MPDPQEQKPWERRYAKTAAPPVVATPPSDKGGVKPWEKTYAKAVAQPQAKAQPQTTTPQATPPPQTPKPEVQSEEQAPWLKRYAEGLRGSMGMDPKGTFTSDIKDMGEGFKQIFTHPINSMGLLMEGAGHAQQEVIDQAYKEQHSPDWMTKVAGVIRGVDASIPGLGPVMSGASDSFRQGDFAGGLGKLTPLIVNPENVTKIKAASMTVDGATRVAQDMAVKAQLDQAEAGRVAHRMTVNEVPNRLLKRKLFEDMYVHAKGIEVGKQVNRAVAEVNKEIKIHSDGIANAIDTNIPSGVIDATDVGQKIFDSFKDQVKTPENVHPAINQLIKDASATAPGQWTWEKVRQFRSSLGRALDKIQGPQKAVATQAYVDLTNRLQTTAKKFGLGKEWEQYNTLASKYHKEFGDLLEDVTTEKSGHKIATKLNTDQALSREAINNLSKYGLDRKDVVKFMSTAKRIQKQQNATQGGLIRMAYGNPYGLAGMAVGATIAGGFWPRVIGGASAGLIAAYITNVARVMRLSPDVIEHMLSERELPGRMKFGGGEFPDDSSIVPTEPQFRDLGGTRGGPSGPRGVEPRPQLPGGGAQLPPTSSVSPQGQLPMGGPPQLPYRQTPKPATSKNLLPNDKGGVSLDPSKYVGTPFTDEGLRSHLGIPEDISLKTLEREGKLIHNPNGTWTPTSKFKGIASPEEVGREPGARPGTTKESRIGRNTKQAERVAKKRGEAKRTREQETTEAFNRARATGVSVEQLQIPEMEEALQQMNREGFDSLQKLRKSKSISDPEYMEALKYYILEAYEKGQD